MENETQIPVGELPMAYATKCGEVERLKCEKEQLTVQLARALAVVLLAREYREAEAEYTDEPSCMTSTNRLLSRMKLDAALAALPGGDK